MKKIIIFIFLTLMFAACHKDEMPDNDGQSVDKEEIIGYWTVESTEAYLDLTTTGAVLAQTSGYNLQEELEKKLKNEAEGKILHFTQETVYCINSSGETSSSYNISKDTLLLANEELIGFHAPKFYLKMTDDNTTMIAYLKKAESLELIKADGSVSGFYMDMIETHVKDAQCEIHFKRE